MTRKEPWMRPRASAVGRRRGMSQRLRHVVHRGQVAHLSLLPQGQPERAERVRVMVLAMDNEGFGGCTNIGECEAACPKEISVENIAHLNRDYLRATLSDRTTTAVDSRSS